MTVLAMSNLAATLESLREFSSALGLREEILQLRRTSAESGDDPDVTEAEARLAWTLYFIGRHAEARPLEEHVVSVRRRQLGDGHASTVLAMRTS
jgi:hypothetical protein